MYSTTIIMCLNYQKVQHKNTSIELLKKYERKHDEALDRYIGPDYLQQNAKPYHTEPFPVPKKS